MKGGNYIFDGEKIDFKKSGRSIWENLWKLLKWILASVSMAIFYYALFSLFISTDTEKKIIEENRMYSRMYPELKEKQRLVADVVEDLKVRDNDIYERLFHTAAPRVDLQGSDAFLSSADTIPDKDIVNYSAARMTDLEDLAAEVESSFLRVFAALASDTVSLPPLTSPFTDFSYAQAGASTGDRLSPFYKVKSGHSGFDMIAGQGTPVLAVADGVVVSVTRSGKGSGNVIEIDHGGGYVTRYAHLMDMNVARGQHVTRGRQIGRVGMSGNSFAPHLHYEVLRNGQPVDPVHYLFASLSPDEYANVAFMASVTGQAMD